MPLGISRDHLALAATIREWAAKVDASSVVRPAETDPAATFGDTWSEVVAMGLTSIALSESVGGGGSDVLDQAIALESAAHGLIPGPVLSTTAVGLLAQIGQADRVAQSIADGGPAGLALDSSVTSSAGALTGDVALALDAVEAAWLAVPVGEAWFAVAADGWTATAQRGIDLTHRSAAVRVDASPEHVVALNVTTADVRRVVVALAAAEASGLASWCLATAVDYAKVREQFGAPIGSFQAIKQLSAGMLEATESVAAVAWDAAAQLTSDDSDFSAEVAAVVAIDGAVSVAQDCIQILGGIGFTFEHDAHLYLRRALALRAVVNAFTGGSDEAARRLAQAAVHGGRSAVAIDFDGADEPFRAPIRAELQAIAALGPDEQRRALVEGGFVTAHLPAPYGRDAGPVEQVVIDDELTAANIQRPDLKIGGWATATVIHHGTDEQRERFVLPTLLGDIVWCQLFSEPGAGSDLAGLSTKAERVDGGWKLTGQKVWTSLAHEAHWAICLARTDRDAAKHRGITFFLVDMTADGIDIRPLREMTGDAMFNEVFLDGVFVPDSDVVGEVNEGWKVSRTTLSSERVAMASTKLGLSTERAVELLAENPSVLNEVRVGRQVALATVCQLIGMRATMRSIAGRGPGPESSVAKLLGVRNRQEASDLVGELLGPRLLAADDPQVAADLHEMLLTRCLSIAGGTTQILRNVVAERVLGLPR